LGGNDQGFFRPTLGGLNPRQQTCNTPQTTDPQLGPSLACTPNHSVILPKLKIMEKSLGMIKRDRWGENTDKGGDGGIREGRERRKEMESQQLPLWNFWLRACITLGTDNNV
jgi:hypothetical protein